MEILLANNVNIDQEVPQLGTPLYVACTHQRVDCVKKLLELGNFQKSCHEKNVLTSLVFHGFNVKILVMLDKILAAFEVCMLKTELLQRNECLDFLVLLPLLLAPFTWYASPR